MGVFNVLVAVCILYVVFLFLIAYLAERRAAAGKQAWLRSPYVYTLSLSVYCTAWTFYGAVGSAARGGLDFLPIYLGPTLVFVAWFFLLRKLVRIGRTQQITSIADLISSRYGKSSTLGVAVTLLAVIASTPYIALQLKSLTLSFSAFAEDAGTGLGPKITAFWVAAGLAAFTILFGTRNLNANERHHGVVTAIAVEAVVKLFALLAVGIFVVWGMFGSPAAVFDAMPPDLTEMETIFTPRWVTLMGLSATAIICLPRMFQVLVVEASDERHLATAAWAFPLYLALISLFVLPIAIAGLATQGPDANPDLFVLTVPLNAGQDGLALLAFLGGFSAATSMVIVATIAVSTMVSNHIVIPIWLRLKTKRAARTNLRRVLLLSRRISIVAILVLGYLYFIVSAPRALAAIGLISFAGMAQVAPALIGALYWRGATRSGALSGIIAGFVIWAYTLMLPSFEGAFLLSAETLANGPFGIAALRPQELLGLEGLGALEHTMFWSMLVNAGLFIIVSLSTRQKPLEQFQAAAFADAFARPAGDVGLVERSAASEDLMALAVRILGERRAQAVFEDAARAQGRTGWMPKPTSEFIETLERQLAGAVGAASAHELVSQIAGRGTVSVDGLMRIADETLQLVEAKRRLEHQSHELEITAQQLREANTQLKRMDAAKDAFLSQVSHELRTPMTSIRSFAEILSDNPEIDAESSQRFLGIIREESERLTRLLDEILDLSFLESGRVTFHIEPADLADLLDRALASTEGLLSDRGVTVERAYREAGAIGIQTDTDRLAQVVINLISNSVKYGRSEDPQITISAGEDGETVWVELADRGAGIPPERREEIFEKFARAGEERLAGSAGLGLPISREIMRRLGGDLRALDSAEGARFRLDMPRVAKPVGVAVASGPAELRAAGE